MFFVNINKTLCTKELFTIRLIDEDESFCYLDERLGSLVEGKCYSLFVQKWIIYTRFDVGLSDKVYRSRRFMKLITHEYAGFVIGL